jgi:CheY-like chemotaxis protein
MDNGTTILVVEDTESDFLKLSEFLKRLGCDSYPEREEYHEFIDNVRYYLSEGSQDKISKGADYLKSKLGSIEPQLILLDVQLKCDSKDRSGEKFLKFLRKQYRYVPVLILSVHPFDEITSMFTEDSKANYYLNKTLYDNVTLSEEFLEKRLDPVITMLLYWEEVAYSKSDIYEALEARDDKLFSHLDKRIGILKYDISEVLGNLNELRKHVDVQMRMVQFNLAKNDKKAEELVENFIAEIAIITDVPVISNNKIDIVEKLENAKEEIMKIFKGEIEEDITSFVADTLKEIIGIEEDETFTKAVLRCVWKAIGKGWRLYRTGEW